MVYSLNYRRPSQVDRLDTIRHSVNGAEKHKSISGSVKSGKPAMSNGIPDALSFDRIIAGGVCPPCTTRDFMNYSKYIEYSAENLQFYLWHRDYCQRFEGLSACEQALSPEWTASQAEAETQAAWAGRRKKPCPIVTSVLQGTDFVENPPQTVDLEKREPFRDPFRDPSNDTPPRTPSSEAKAEADSTYGSSFGDEKALTSNHAVSKRADEVFEEAGLNWKPFTAQPFRQEVAHIISLYIAVDGPRQLNLSDRERSAVLHALQSTTHPSAFHAAFTSVDWSLRVQAHPNFIRWTICNANRPRVVFARVLGISLMFAGFLAELLITLSHVHLAWRVLPIIIILLGTSTLLAAWKGLCMVLHGMHHRHVRPWELFADEDDPIHSENPASQESLVRHSYEDEPWVAKYKKRNIARKIFDREVWIQEPALRQIQDTIFLQSVLGAFVLSIFVVGIFCALPTGNLF